MPGPDDQRQLDRPTEPTPAPYGYGCPARQGHAQTTARTDNDESNVATRSSDGGETFGEHPPTRARRHRHPGAATRWPRPPDSQLLPTAPSRGGRPPPAPVTPEEPGARPVLRPASRQARGHLQGLTVGLPGCLARPRPHHCCEQRFCRAPAFELPLRSRMEWERWWVTK